VGGGLLGKYCKGEAAGSDGKRPVAGKEQAADAAANTPASLSGTYRAGDRDMSIALAFKPDQKVRVTVAGKNAKKESVEATYKVSGDRVTISVPDGSPPLVLTRKGDTLEGAPEGETVKMKFVKE
jgi:hypothetical protein